MGSLALVPHYWWNQRRRGGAAALVCLHRHLRILPWAQRPRQVVRWAHHKAPPVGACMGWKSHVNKRIQDSNDKSSLSISLLSFDAVFSVWKLLFTFIVGVVATIIIHYLYIFRSCVGFWQNKLRKCPVPSLQALGMELRTLWENISLSIVIGTTWKRDQRRR